MMLKLGCMGTNLGTLTTFGHSVPKISVPNGALCRFLVCPTTSLTSNKTCMKVSTQLRKVTRKDGSKIGIVYFRVRGKGKDLRASSSLTIDPEHWDGEVPGYSASVISKVVSPIVAKEFNNHIQDILYAINTEYSEDADAAWLNKVVNSAGAASMEPATPSPNDDKRERKKQREVPNRFRQCRTTNEFERSPKG